MIKKLRKKFIHIAVLAVTAVLVLLCVIVNAATYFSVDSQLNQTLDMLSQNEGRMPEKPPTSEMQRGAFPDKPFTKETPFSTRFFVLFFDDEGQLVKSDLGHIAAVTEEDVSEYCAFAAERGAGRGYTANYKYEILKDGEGKNRAIFLDCYKERQFLYRVGIFSVIATVVCIALVTLIVVLLSGKAIDPLVKNAERQKQFVTDASHELKTPITVIATSLKALEIETGQHKWIDKAKNQTEKLTELVSALVTLSRMDESDPIHKLHFPVSDSVRETAESYLDFAGQNGHALQIEIEPDLTYYGDEYTVRQLVSILIDNAVKYATAGGTILLSLEKTKKGIAISTVNGCTNITPDDANKLFDRFYRTDKSRNADTGGFGIGLSIVRAVAEAHDGFVRASLTEDDCLKITAELN